MKTIRNYSNVSGFYDYREMTERLLEIKSFEEALADSPHITTDAQYRELCLMHTSRIVFFPQIIG